jgi:hypothetical protein
LRSASTVILAALALCGVGCSEPGTQPPASAAAKLGVATSRISVACGYADELMAFGGKHAPGLGVIESIATSGAAKLAGVYRRNQTWIFQGESVAGIVHDSISLLGGCDLPGARQVLVDALH